jgi:hypothetical protein
VLGGDSHQVGRKLSGMLLNRFHIVNITNVLNASISKPIHQACGDYSPSCESLNVLKIYRTMEGFLLPFLPSLRKSVLLEGEWVMEESILRMCHVSSDAHVVLSHAVSPGTGSTEIRRIRKTSAEQTTES